MQKLVLPLAALTFCTWAVSLAGVASLQDDCIAGWSDALGNIDGFTAGLSCMRLFRYTWFIVCMEAVLLFALAGAVTVGFFERSRMAWIGLFSVATLLYISMTNSYLAAQNTFQALGSQPRSQTMLAGALMTACVNCALIFAMGVLDNVSPATAKAVDSV